jgi:hypothetical protein
VLSTKENMNNQQDGKEEYISHVMNKKKKPDSINLQRGTADLEWYIMRFVCCGFKFWKGYIKINRSQINKNFIYRNKIKKYFAKQPDQEDDT